VSDQPAFSEAELEDPRLAYLKNYNYRSMNCGRGSAEIITVVGTSGFQEELGYVAAAPRPWRHRYDRHLPALLVPRRDDLADVAVLIDARVIGYLPRKVAEQHRDQLKLLGAGHQHLACSALIAGGDEGKNLGVRLQIKPGIRTRWAVGAKL
jgi:hypothetical protein